MTKNRLLKFGKWICYLLIGAILGAVTGGVSYLGVGLLLEFSVVPLLVSPEAGQLSYGQQAAFIMTPLAVLFGAAIGSSLALGRLGSKLWCAGGLFISTLVVLGIVSLHWVSQVNDYGRDVSELVLYGPFVAAGVVALVIAARNLIRRNLDESSK